MDLKIKKKGKKRKFTVADVDFPHPWVYLRLRRVVDVLGCRRRASRGLLLLEGGRFGRAVPVDQQRAAASTASAAAAGARTRGRDRALPNSVLGLGLGDGGRDGHRGARQRVRWRGQGRRPRGVGRLAVPDRLH